MLRTATRWQTVSHPTLGVRVSERRNALAYKRQLRREEKRTAMTPAAWAVPDAQCPHFQRLRTAVNRQKTLTHRKNQPITIPLDGDRMV
ncbi:MAG: hypothetical protein QOD67_3634 [Caballeronia sp.]|nr:hypothetical protein [Caballeronia sp.]